jgi:hypothetical protein
MGMQEGGPRDIYVCLKHCAGILQFKKTQLKTSQKMIEKEL